MMSIAQTLLAEFEPELAKTRKVLERVPMEKRGWQPHLKSASLGWMAGHVANLPGLGVRILTQTDTVGDLTQRVPHDLDTNDSLLEIFDERVEMLRKHLEEASDEHLEKIWNLHTPDGGTVFLSVPRVVALRGFVLHHLIHHRGQLTMYLRLLDIPLPGLYGPSADEEVAHMVEAQQ
jgi:uncharacterized damage-inducible protein DinB